MTKLAITTTSYLGYVSQMLPLVGDVPDLLQERQYVRKLLSALGYAPNTFREPRCL